MNHNQWLIGAIALIFCCSCKNGTKPEQSQSGDHLSPLEAYCLGIDYHDTLALHDNKVMTKRMTRIVQLLPVTHPLSANAALSHFLNGIKHDVGAVLAADSLAELYLNNPASPVRNEDLYIAYLNTLITTDSIPDFIRERGAVRLKTASLNRPGSIATDICFLSREGERQSLHELKSECTLLVFYDPECSHCTSILHDLAVNPRINSAIADGTMTVVAIYAEGKKDVWKKALHQLPKNWIVGFDLSGILENDLYDLPAMPVVYLLDEDKRVIKKDLDTRIFTDYQ